MTPRADVVAAKARADARREHAAQLLGARRDAGQITEAERFDGVDALRGLFDPVYDLYIDLSERLNGVTEEQVIAAYDGLLTPSETAS